MDVDLERMLKKGTRNQEERDRLAAAEEDQLRPRTSLPRSPVKSSGTVDEMLVDLATPTTGSSETGVVGFVREDVSGRPTILAGAEGGGVAISIAAAQAPVLRPVEVGLSSKLPGKEPTFYKTPGGRTVSIRVKTSPIRTHSLDRSKKRGRTEVDEEEEGVNSLTEALMSMETKLETLENLARMSGNDDMRAVAHGIKFELLHALNESKKLGASCAKCKGALRPLLVNNVTQTITHEQVTIEEIRRGLECGVEEEKLRTFLAKKWPEEVFSRIKKGVESPLEERKGDVAVLLDLNTATPLLKKKLYKLAPNVKELDMAGKLKDGRLLVDGHSAKDLFGEADVLAKRKSTLLLWIQKTRDVL